LVESSLILFGKVDYPSFFKKSVYVSLEYL